MSRVGREPIPLPPGISVTIDARTIQVKGKLGALSRVVPDGIEIAQEGSLLKVTRRDDSKPQRALHGLTRALVANMVKGVTQGYQKDLELVGVGYRVEQRGKALQLSVGYSHKVLFFAPENIELKANSPSSLTVKGIDKELVGEVAAKIRAVRPPEPYKGKGLKYANETIRRKAGKTAGK